MLSIVANSGNVMAECRSRTQHDPPPLFLLDNATANLKIRIYLQQVYAARCVLTSRQYKTADAFVEGSGIPACAHCSPQIPCKILALSAWSAALSSSI